MDDLDTKRNDEMLQILQGLIRNWEHEIVEFKRASKDFKQSEIGEYFSAISNEANLKGLQHGWLVFGVDNKTREIVDTDYRDRQGLETLKHEIAQNTTGAITFLDIYEVYESNNRMVMFKIPAAVASIPTAWKGRWYGRDGESLVPLSLEELDRLRGQARHDWTNRVIDSSGIDYLDKDAVAKARKGYKERHNSERISLEIDSMSDEDFLSKLRLIVNGKLTYAAMILLGNPDYDNLLDRPVQIMWRLFDSGDMTADYQEFRMPYIMVVDRVFAKVRNLTYRYIPNRRSLTTVNIPKYDNDLQRELLHNSIAHMDYTQGGRIYVDEFEDYFLVQNPGLFLPRDVLPVLSPGYNAPYYRNPLLAEAMMRINMIDTITMGIRKVFRVQQERLFPMPDYFSIRPDSTTVKVYGKTLDVNYTYMLYDHPEFDIETVYLIDQVQKRQPLSKEQYMHLRSLGAIKGRVPNVFISPLGTGTSNEQTQDAESRNTDDENYIDLIVGYLKQYGHGTKADFIRLLSGKLPDDLSDKQKDDKTRNLLAFLRREGQIHNTSPNRRSAVWELTESAKQRILTDP